MSLIIQELRFQMRHGFGLAYLLVVTVYTAGLHLLPAPLAPWAAAFLLLTDPMTVGLVFVGGVVQLEGSMQLVPALFVTPLRPERFLLYRVVSFALLGVAIALLLLSLAPATVYTEAPLGRAGTLGVAVLVTLLASATLTVAGAAVAYAVSSINGYILAIVPLLFVAALPFLGWIPGLAGAWFFWSPTFLPIYVFGLLFGLPGVGASTATLVVATLFLAGWGVAAGWAALRMLERRLRLSVGGG